MEEQTEQEFSSIKADALEFAKLVKKISEYNGVFDIQNVADAFIAKWEAK